MSHNTTSNFHLPLPADSDPIRNGASEIRQLSTKLDSELEMAKPQFYRRIINVNLPAGHTQIIQIRYHKREHTPFVVASVVTPRPSYLNVTASEVTTEAATICLHSPTTYRGEAHVYIQVHSAEVIRSL